MEVFDVVFGANSKYVKHLSVAIYSLLKNNLDAKFRIWIVNDGLVPKDWRKLKNLNLPNLLDIENILVSDELFKDLKLTHHFTKEMYYRLLIPTFIKSNKALYLDCDLVVLGCIRDFYNQDISDFYLAGVKNFGFDYHQKLGMDLCADYFNSGVLLINIKKWKQDKLLENVMMYIHSNSHNLMYPDQDALNAVINGRWKKAHLKYNQQSNFFVYVNTLKGRELDEMVYSISTPTIIHYTGSSKPWHFLNNHKFKKYYWQYLALTNYWPCLPDFQFFRIYTIFKTKIIDFWKNIGVSK